MKISMDAVRELRNLTSASVYDCKKALEDAGGNIQKASDLLRQRGLEIASQKQGRIAKEGRIEAYVHTGNKIGVLLEVDCETDFVARSQDFSGFTKDIAMQIAACHPLYIKREDVPAEALQQAADKEQFCREHCLLEQAFIKDPAMTIKDCLVNLISRLGENIVIRRFVRYKIGE